MFVCDQEKLFVFAFARLLGGSIFVILSLQIPYKLLQLFMPLHALFRRFGTQVYFDAPDSRDCDSTFFRILPGLNMTLRRAGT